MHDLRSLPARLVRVLAGPQGLAILSGVLLAAYWFGGEGLLLFGGLAIPGGIALVSLANGSRRGTAGRDGLTGLHSRNAAMARLTQMLAADGSESISCFALGLDEFDEVCRAHGSMAIDEIMTRTAERLSQALRGGDVLARSGSGEFTAIVASSRQSDLEACIQIAARLLAAVGEPMSVGGARLHLTASCGFVLQRQLSRPNAEEVLCAAEVAMMGARRQGRGSIRAFSPTERRPRVTPGKLVEEAPAALENGEIQAWFQPQVSTDTGAVVGFEALARWQHPVLGMIAPAEFLPAIIEADRAGQLSQAILGQSLSALKGWHRAGIAIPRVAVNLGQEELRDPSLVDRVKWELDRQDLTPDRLCVEILEAVLQPGGDDIVTRNLTALTDLGIAFDLDDFGTGTASIAAIRRFSVDRIKIDRSFVSRVDTDPAQQEMAAAILSMAERLKLDTIAEGVESAGEHAMLAQLGCAAVQGFGIAPPMPFDETIGWLQRHNALIAEAPALTRKIM
jgi:diguanylate cyclase (GGDEF)-like protein